MYFFVLEVISNPEKNPIIIIPVDNTTKPDTEEKTGITVN